MPDFLAYPCHAKVNLFLRILARSSDGYHQLETLFTRIDLHDTLEVERTASGITLSVSGSDLGAQEENLAWRAADMILEATGRRFGVAMRLTKRIPAGAGLGGGSSDAAAALHAVNALADERVPLAELLTLGARLGADVPFFVSKAPAALAWGRGQRMLQLPAPPARPALLLVPEFAISTATAFAWFAAAREPGLRGAVILNYPDLAEWSTLARISGNDLETTIFGEYPSLRESYLALARTGPILCRMTGSGSTLVAVYRTEESREHALQELGQQAGRLIRTTIGT